MSDSTQFDPATTSKLVRAYYTPVSDALRGHLSGRLDVRHTIAAAGLPQPIAGLIYTVCRRTRLWRREQHDVARELSAHFADGLAAGVAIDKLASEFGSPDQAARLIRRAKKRNRPLWWQTWRVGSRLLLILLTATLLTYAALSARYYLGRPTIARNYWHEINADRKAGEEERAWPIYREASLKMGRDEIDTGWLDEGPLGKNFDKAVAIIDRHRESIELIRKAAMKPRLGYLLGDPADWQAAVEAQQKWKFNDQSADDNTCLLEVLLDGIQEQRRLARLLNGDARLAAIRGDGAAVLADLTALIGMAEQLFQPDAFVVDQLVGIAVFGVAMETVGTILEESPQVFSEDQLRALAHRISAYRGGATAIDFSSERMVFDDLLQRAFTDDGQGNGRITPEGVRLLLDAVGSQGSALDLVDPKRKDEIAPLVAGLLSPGVAALMGSREENRALYHTMLDEMIAAHQGPAWQWDRKALDSYEARLCEMTGARPGHLKFWLVAHMLPALAAANSAAERSAQVRDAAEVAIALEIWRRRHGEWPRELGQLVPDLLPAIPPDRADGKPLRYLVRDGQARLYSLGADRDDDGGLEAAAPDDAMLIQFGPVAAGESRNNPDGDWILWPPRKEPPEGEEPMMPAESPVE